MLRPPTTPAAEDTEARSPFLVPPVPNETERLKELPRTVTAEKNSSEWLQVAAACVHLPSTQDSPWGGSRLQGVSRGNLLPHILDKHFWDHTRDMEECSQ